MEPRQPSPTDRNDDARDLTTHLLPEATPGGRSHTISHLGRLSIEVMLPRDSLKREGEREPAAGWMLSPASRRFVFVRAQAWLRRAQRRVARRKKGRHRRRKAVQVLQRVHAHIRSQRRDFHHQVARMLVKRYGLIVVEDLNIKGLAGGMLAQSGQDAAWGAFLRILLATAGEAVRVGIRVDAPGTSQECPGGAAVPQALGDRWHYCVACGLSVPRDHAAALCIMSRGRRL